MQSQRMYDIVVLSFALLALGSRALNLCAQSHVRIVNFELKFLVLDIHRDIIAIAIEFSQILESINARILYALFIMKF